MRLRIAMLLGLAGCQGKPPAGSGLVIEVQRGSGQATCARVTITDGVQTLESEAMTFRDGGVARLGVFREDLGVEITAIARGGQSPGCAPLASAEEASGTFRFPASGSDTVTLVLRRTTSAGDAAVPDAGAPDSGTRPDAGVSDAGEPDAGEADAGPAADAGLPDAGQPDAGPVDADGDGVPAGVDCDDNDPRVFPGNTERCWGGLDDDCNAFVDCADSACSGAICGSSADAGARCMGTVCRELDCGNGLDDDLDTATDCPDPDCAARPCAGGGCDAGVCVQPTETNCTDGQDNDGDRAIDCADPDCAGRSCSDGLSCRQGETCMNLTCAPGPTVISCVSPPNTTCFMASGACQEPDAGCSYQVIANTQCNDGVRCTRADVCLVDGGCLGTRVTCTQTAAQCLEPTGTCVEADGGCSFPQRTNGSGCDDGNPCTRGDACQSGTCTPGPTVSCSPNACQTLGPSCLSDGGCDLRSRAAGTPCPGGVCDGQGACGFPYRPSNVDPGPSLALRDAGSLLVDCATTWTISPDAGVTVVATGTACSAAAPRTRLQPQDGGADLLVVTANSLTVTDGGALRIVGATFPVAFVVLGDVDIGGSIDVSAGVASGPGGNSAQLCGASRGGPGQILGTSPRGGGGGGGFGSAGAPGGMAGTGPADGGSGGPASGNAALVPLRGGCQGGTGGGANNGGGVGGRAGGAIQISAAGQLRVRGLITSAGGGGLGADADADPDDGPGGGGGGSGGAILLEGFRVTVTGFLTANGGGGGEGERAGGRGIDGEPGGFYEQTGAPGGAGASTAGNGGRGGSRLEPATGGENSPANNGGGGGGGGGFGRIRINSVDPCTGPPQVVSPRADSPQASCTF